MPLPWNDPGALPFATWGKCTGICIYALMYICHMLQDCTAVRAGRLLSRPKSGVAKEGTNHVVEGGARPEVSKAVQAQEAPEGPYSKEKHWAPPSQQVHPSNTPRAEVLDNIHIWAVQSQLKNRAAALWKRSHSSKSWPPCTVRLMPVLWAIPHTIAVVAVFFSYSAQSNVNSTIHIELQKDNYGATLK